MLRLILEASIVSGMADYLSPGTVQQRLQVSSAGLRRLAVVYEQVHGPLPRDQRSGRVYSAEAVERLERARELVKNGRSPSVEAALRGVELAEGVEGGRGWQRPPDESLAALVDEVRLLREAVEAQTRRMASLEEENRQLRERMPELEQPERSEERPQDDVENYEGGSSRPDDTEQSRGSQEPEASVAGRFVRWLRGGRQRG